MALPATHVPSLTPQEMEFLAEEDHLSIVPLFGMDSVRLLSGVYGPFRPPQKTRVPVWLAVNLKKKRRCHVVPPDWLNVELLQSLLATEQSLNDSLAPLPSKRFLEISKLLLDAGQDLVWCPDNLLSPSSLRSLLKDIREVRQAKLRTAIIPQIGVEGTGLNGEYLQLTHLSPLEINELRPFFVRAMGVMGKLEFEQERLRKEGGQGGGDGSDDED